MNFFLILRPTNLGITIFFFFFAIVFMAREFDGQRVLFVAPFRGQNVGAIIFFLVYS
jgi:hypothetical protein